ncbi:MAG: hypothetical protein Q9188_001884 [Gyalolechia gomerana]
MAEDLGSSGSKGSVSHHDRETNTTIGSTITGSVNERKLLMKVDLRTLPILTIIYVLAFLDSPTLTKGVRNFGGLVTVRFLLGIVEAGIFPGCFYLMGMWYMTSEAQKRFSFFFNASSFAGAFGGLLASAIGLMDGMRGYHAWRWIFILEGCLTCVVSILAYFVVADFPEHARWLNDDERDFIVSRLMANQGSSGVEKKITVQSFLDAFRDWRMIPGALMYFGPTVSAYGLAYFIPSIVRTYGYKPIQAQLHSVVPWAAAVVFAMAMAFASDTIQKRSPFILVGLCFALIGNVVLLTVHTNKEAEFASLVLYTMGVICVLPIIAQPGKWGSATSQG